MVKAAVCREFGVLLSIEDITVSAPGPGEVRVEVNACAICHSDTMLADGAWGGELPAVYGHEAAGVVESIGDEVDTVAVGDSSQVEAIPDGLAWASASLLGCGVITGVGAVTTTAEVEVGSHVVVIGCGGVGLNALQGASIAGARTVIAVDLESSKREGAAEFGATHTVDGAARDLVEQVRAITDGWGADYVFAAGGAVVIVGMTPTGVSADIDTTSLADSSQRILGSKMGSDRLAIDIPKLVGFHQQGRLKLDELVSNTYRLDQINEAIESARAGIARRNVVVFDD